MDLLARKYWERPYLDMWSVPHTLMGTLVAGAVVWSSIDDTVGFLAVVMLAIVWELVEAGTGISRVEEGTNHLTDIIVAVMGYAAGKALFRLISSEALYATVYGLIAVIFLGVTLVGWIAYRRYVYTERKKRM